jgi:hypothetical protein
MEVACKNLRDAALLTYSEPADGCEWSPRRAALNRALADSRHTSVDVVAPPNRLIRRRRPIAPKAALVPAVAFRRCSPDSTTWEFDRGEDCRRDPAKPALAPRVVVERVRERALVEVRPQAVEK